MLRKQIVPRRSSEPISLAGEISIADVATVQVTSEDADHPIDNAFDHNRGPGGSRWIADGPGAQTVILLVDSPQTIRKIGVEIRGARGEPNTRAIRIRLLGWKADVSSARAAGVQLQPTRHEL
jgi:hypothetical protein